MKTKKPDSRPRFGWTKTLDNIPQIIMEGRFEESFPVVVIPLPFTSPLSQEAIDVKKRVREFTKSLWLV